MKHSSESRRTKLGLLLEILAWTILIAPLFYLWLNWGEIPARVPLHFNISGEPDRWGPKFGLLIVPIVGFPAFLILWVASWKANAIGRIKLPKSINPNDPRVSPIFHELYAWMMFFFAVIVAFVVWVQIQVGVDPTRRYGWVPVMTLIAAIPLILIVYSRRLNKLS